MIATWGDVKSSGMAERLGFSNCGPEFQGLFNKATDELAACGIWWGTYARIRICPSSNCITWPRNVMTVQALSNYGAKIRPVNQWYEFESIVPRCDCQFAISMDGDISPIFGTIGATALKLRVYSNAADDGKTVLITGTTDGDHQVRSGTAPSRINGETVTLAAPYVETTAYFRTVTGIQKPVTQYGITLRKWDGTTETIIGDYEPGETRPYYRRTYLTNQLLAQCGCTSVVDQCESATCAQPLLKAIVKLQPVKPVAETDWIFIPNLVAMEEMMRSINYRTKHELEESEIARKFAIRSMRQWSDQFEGGVERTLITVDFDAGAFNRTFRGFN